jgi:hypothetical protein
MLQLSSGLVLGFTALPCTPWRTSTFGTSFVARVTQNQRAMLHAADNGVTVRQSEQCQSRRSNPRTDSCQKVQAEKRCVPKGGCSGRERRTDGDARERTAVA